MIALSQTYIVSTHVGYLAEVSWTSVGMFWISLMLAIVTVAAAAINYRIYRTQIEPHVIVYASIDSTLLFLVIENVGKGLARNVQFDLSEPIPERAVGMSPADAPEANTMTDGVLIKGIPSLGPGDSRRIFWGQYGGLEKALGNKLVYVTCLFSDHTGRRLEPVECCLEINSFRECDAAERDGSRLAATQLEKIAKDLNHISTGFRQLRVNVDGRLQSEPVDRRIVGFEFVDDWTLRIVFDDGTVRLFDPRKVLDFSGSYAQFAENKYFRTGRLDRRRGSIVWRAGEELTAKTAFAKGEAADTDEPAVMDAPRSS